MNFLVNKSYYFLSDPEVELLGLRMYILKIWVRLSKFSSRIIVPCLFIVTSLNIVKVGY